MHHDPLETSLKPYNTFGLDANCKGIFHIYNEQDLLTLLDQNIKPFKIIGGGSNILLTDDIEENVLRNEIKGIEIIEEDEKHLLVRVGAGEIWHQFVMWSLSQRLSGLENLSLIPGSVGAAPMQNIGAYGVEQESAFHSLSAIHIETGLKQNFDKDACRFGYRESVFKNTFKNQYFITHVTYLLHKSPQQQHLSYGAINDILNAKNITNPSSLDIAEAVIEIRKAKLPDTRIIGNAGSFFKNPVISIEQYEDLKGQYREIPHYPASERLVKVPAAWLIDRLGFKGLIRNGIGVHKNQALVLVHYGNGTGKDILNLAYEIQNKVKEVFNIEITPEVNIW